METTVKGLNSKVLHRTFVDAWTDFPKNIKRPKDFDSFKKEIKGKKILRVWRRAKNVIIELSDNYSLLVHQKMTGHLLVGNWTQENGNFKPEGKGPLQDPQNRFIHLVFWLDDGRMIALSDLRKFAKVELWKTEELLNSKEFKKIGPEPLEKDFTFEKFKERLTGPPSPKATARRGKIKQILMKPEIIAGIGNIYSSEALWKAEIHPERDVSKLNIKELEELYEAIKKVLMLGIKLGGESFSDYRNVEGKKGEFDTERKVYQREDEKCSRCGAKIKRIKIGQRSAFFCPACQKL